VLGAAQRLRRRSEFTATVRGGRRGSRGVLVVHLSRPAVGTSTAPARTGEQELPPRAGFVVTRAVGGAVARNRVRRRLRHLVRDRLAGLPASATLVVRALPGAAERGYAQLADDLDGAIAAAQRPRGADRGGRAGSASPPRARAVPAPAADRPVRERR
jgi:ribonuclease P protein component